MKRALATIRGWLLLLSIMALATPQETHPQAVGQSHNTVPAANASFIPNLQTFVTDEPAKIFQDTWPGGGFVVTGCSHGTMASLVATPAACTAYPGGYYATESGSITYQSNVTCWVVVNRDTTGALGNFARVAGTHYMIDCIDVAQPALPANSTWLMQVTTSTGSVTAVTDLRSFAPETITYTQALLPAAGLRGRLALVRDVGTGVLCWDNGSAWICATTNPMTAAGDLITGGASGVPARLPLGTANQLLGVNTGATATEYKTMTAGTGVVVTPASGAITFSLSGSAVPPTGSITMYAGTAAPAGWLLCDGTAYNATTQSSLALVIIPNANIWGRGTAVGNFTYSNTTGTFTLNSHGQLAGNLEHLANSGGALPSAFATNAVYYIVNATLNTFQLAATSGGAAITGGDNGSGTNTLYNQFQVPDARGRAAIGTGTGSGLTARTIGATTGAETITTAMMPVHNHGITDPGHQHTERGRAAGGTGDAKIIIGASAGGAEMSDDVATKTLTNTTGITTQNTGSGAADGNFQPSLVFTYIIKT